jgi:hypothetical protein
MSSGNSIDLQSDALRLEELNRFMVKAVIDSDMDALNKLLPEYIEVRKRVKTQLMDNPAPQIHNRKALDVLQQLSEDKTLAADRIVSKLEDTMDVSGQLMELTEEEIETLGIQKFYSWFSHYDYIQCLYEIGSLILGITVPPHLRQFVSEAKECYAFQQYNAVYSLCRTILEASVKHICEKCGLLRDRTGKVITIESYRWDDLKNKAAVGDMRDNAGRIYQETSTLIHGRKTITPKEARETFRETLKVVHSIYKHRGF